MFILDSKLQADTYFIHNFEMSSLLLMNDSNYPWLILVPRKPALKEITDLSFDEQVQVLQEINIIAAILKKEFGADKLNIANLGNVVSQLHIHVIARFKNDASFPKPVWGVAAVKPYEENEAQKLIERIKSCIEWGQTPNGVRPQECLTPLERDSLVKKLSYRSNYRGCKETDILLGKFFNEKYLGFDDEKLKLYSQFLEEDDLLIYDWILAKADVPEVYEQLVGEVREFHNI